MNKLQKTQAIVLRRTNFGEADRIINFLTPQGEITGIARGSRKQKSKLAGGIEVFSLNEVVFADGKSEMKTITSARSKEFFSEIIKDLERTEFAYFAISQISKHCKHFDSPLLFEILLDTFEALNDLSIDIVLIQAWFKINLAVAVGEEINLEIDNYSNPLKENEKYSFDFSDKVFVLDIKGDFDANHIKFLRLMITLKPKHLLRVKNIQEILFDISLITKAL